MISVLLFLFCSWAAASQSEVLDLNGAVHTALDSNLSVIQAREKLSEVQNRKWEAYSKLIPTLSAFGRYSYKKDAVAGTFSFLGGNPYNLYEVGLGLRAPLYKGGGEWAGIRLLSREDELRKLELSALERDLTLRVIRGYFKTAFHEARLKLLQRDQDLQRDLHQYIAVRTKTGAFKRLDLLQVQTQLELFEPSILQTKNELVLSAAEMANLLNLNGEEQIRILAQLDSDALVKWDEFEKIRNPQQVLRPELERARLQESSVEDRKSMELAQHWPAISAFADWGRTTTKRSRLFETSATAWATGIEVNVPLFSGMSSVFQRNALVSQQKQSELEVSRLMETIRLEQIRAERELKIARASIEANQRAVAVAREAEKEARQRYRNGTVTYMQFSQASQSLLTSETAVLNARYDLVVKLAEFFYAFGLPFENYFKCLN